MNSLRHTLVKRFFIGSGRVVDRFARLNHPDEDIHYWHRIECVQSHCQSRLASIPSSCTCDHPTTARLDELLTRVCDGQPDSHVAVKAAIKITWVNQWNIV